MHLIYWVLLHPSLFLILLQLVDKPVGSGRVQLINLDAIGELVSASTTNYDIVPVSSNLERINNSEEIQRIWGISWC